MDQTLEQIIKQKQKKSIKCRYAEKCTKKNCTFVHPPKPNTCMYIENKNCIFVHPTKQQAFCRNGSSCMRKDCKFRHPNFCLLDGECDNVNCELEHLCFDDYLPYCRFGSKCNNQNCYYRHSKPNNIIDLFPSI